MSASVSSDHYVFFANDGVSGREVWVTDQTEAGTFMLKNIGPGSQDLGYNGRLMPLPDGRLMFLGNDGAGDKLWATDGTSAGTVILKDAPADFINEYFAMADGRLLFQMFGGSGAELWISDGTSDGTMILKDINSSQMNGGSMPSGFKALNDGRVVFSANDGTHGSEVWVTDGTTAGTVLVKDINTSADSWEESGASSSPAFFTRLGDGRLIFRAEDGVNGNELWVTDGTEAGTQLLKDIAPGVADSYMTQPATLPDGRVIFSADMGGTVGRELWITDGTTAGTVLVKDIQPGSNSSSLGGFVALSDGRMVFSATTTNTGHELWVTDGSAAGTFMLKEINPGTAHSYPSNFTPLADGRLVFGAASASNGYELWVTDGTSNGTTMVADMVAGAGSFYPQNFTALKDGRVSFMATGGDAGFELWVTDGTAAGTHQVKDINPGTGSSQPSRLQAVTPHDNASPAGEPDVAGTPTQGQVLTASLGTLTDADGFNSAAVTYHWQRETGAGQFTDIADATGPTYTLTQTDVGHVLRVAATYVDGHGTTETVLSTATAVVTNTNDTPTGAPAIAGMAQQGDVLLASAGNLADVDGMDATAISYQWQRQASDGTWQDIAGASGTSRALEQADVGHVLRVAATYVDGHGVAETVFSIAPAAVTNTNDAPTGAVVLTGASSGTLVRGEMLTASNTLADADGLGAISYHWQRGGETGGYADIDGATGDTYLLGRDDVGHSLRLVANYTDGHGTLETVTGSGTELVTARSIAVENVGNEVSRPIEGLTSSEIGMRLADGDVLAPAEGTSSIHLTDGTISYAADSDAAYLTRLYGGLLGRGGDANGLSSWAHMSGGGLDKIQVATSFLNSAEYQANHAGLTDAQFVDNLYGSLLGRGAEEAGSAYFNGLLAAGVSRAEVLAAVADSAEAQAHWSSISSAGIFVPSKDVGLVRATYETAFGRDADPDGLAFHTAFLREGATISQFGDVIESSTEFQVVHGAQNDHDFVASLYQQGLGRAGSEEEIGHYEVVLASHASDRGDVVMAFATSVEGQAHLHWAL